MKTSKKMFAFFMSLVIVMSFSVFGTIQSYAHSAMLNVNYDNCEMNENGDGINEMWYSLVRSSECRHIPEDVYTIKYYIEESGSNAYTWTSDVTIDEAQEIKNDYVNSMKKWNNVYFYSYNSSGVVEKRKLINITEGTASDHNLSIYPMPLGGESNPKNNIATTKPVDTGNTIEFGMTRHKHYNEWRMDVCVPYFSYEKYSERTVDFIRDRNGAHELGHVLGLRDVDAAGVCNADNSDSVEHHYEILMGYGELLTYRAKDIQYKDIAGVAITRGFHTDADHMWLNAGVQSDGQYKLICSICNGVKMVGSLSGYTYNTYGACNNRHRLANGNMMAVASYENKDYYKCRYCRYVAPFYSNRTQNYSKTNYNSSLHQCVNNVNGLNYTFYEEHSPYVYLNKYYHRRSCSCGIGVQKERHTISASDVSNGRYLVPCMECRYLLDLRDDYYNSIASITQVSINGSYILPGGIIVLVDEDVQAYLDGTLVFYHPDDIPATQ